jgi:hypothetical protein
MIEKCIACLDQTLSRCLDLLRTEAGLYSPGELDLDAGLAHVKNDIGYQINAAIIQLKGRLVQLERIQLGVVDAEESEPCQPDDDGPQPDDDGGADTTAHEGDVPDDDAKQRVVDLLLGRLFGFN